MVARAATPTSLKQGSVRLSELVGRIRDAFPELEFTRGVLNDLGEDHAVVVLDDRWVLRFPRSLEAASCAGSERRLLAILRDVVRLPVPAYEFVSAVGDFGGYRMIQGQPLSEQRFAGLGRPRQERVLDEIGDFLGALHALPIDALAAADRRIRRGHRPGADYARRFLERRPAFAAALSTKLLSRVDAFYDGLSRAVDGAPNTLVHSDFTEDHILLAPSGDRLAGVIDFTDAGLGDPAFDFTFLWAYGDWAAMHAASRYGAGHEPAYILARSRWWFARYRIDQIWWSLNGDREYDVAKISAELPRVFDSLEF